MRNVLKIFKVGFLQILRDGMLLILIPAPFLMGAALRVLLPIADRILKQQLGFTIAPWYPLSDAMLLTITPVMMAMICAFVMLDERDEEIGIYYNVTPAGGYSYLISRIALPMVWGYISTILVMSIFAFADYYIFTIFIASLIGTMQGIIMSMLLVAIAGNKVEGLALAKLTNILVMGFMVPWFIQSPYKYIFSILPSFWIGEILLNNGLQSNMTFYYGLAGLVSCLIWIVVFTKIFLKRIY